MNKAEIKSLRDRADKVFAEVHDAIISLTAKKPFELFDRNKSREDIEDEIYDYPHGYSVGKYGDYMQGAIQKIEGNQVSLYLTGEDNWGEEYWVGLDSIPFACLIDVLEIIENERAEA